VPYDTNAIWGDTDYGSGGSDYPTDAPTFGQVLTLIQQIGAVVVETVDGAVNIAGADPATQTITTQTGVPYAMCDGQWVPLAQAQAACGAGVGSSSGGVFGLTALEAAVAAVVLLLVWRST
jgi:hypothetical protein